MKIRLNVRELVDARGWSVEEFAERAGLDPATARGVYAGESTEMDLADHSRISQALDVLPNEILAAVDEPHSEESERNIDSSRYQHPELEPQIHPAEDNERSGKEA